MSPSAWEVRVDRAACLGSAVCAASAPQHFRLVDGRATPVSDRAPASDDLLTVAAACPAAAIAVHRSDGTLIEFW